MASSFPIIELQTSNIHSITLSRFRGSNPVILGLKDSVESYYNNKVPFLADLEKLYTQTEEFRFEDWAASRITSNPTLYQAELGQWENREDSKEPFSIYFTEEERSYLLGLLPINFIWEAPAFLGFGGWNECPLPHEHSAILKYWDKKYDIRSCHFLDEDFMQVKISRPPLSKEDCMNLAQEHFIYCPDNVDQGTGTISSLAMDLKGNDTWIFWWD